MKWLLSTIAEETERNTILTALKDFESKTCIRFVPRAAQRIHLSIEPRLGWVSNWSTPAGKVLKFKSCTSKWWAMKSLGTTYVSSLNTISFHLSLCTAWIRLCTCSSLSHQVLEVNMSSTQSFWHTHHMHLIETTSNVCFWWQHSSQNSTSVLLWQILMMFRDQRESTKWLQWCSSVV